MSISKELEKNIDLINKIYPSHIRNLLEVQTQTKLVTEIQERISRMYSIFTPMQVTKYNNLISLIDAGTSLAGQINRIPLAYFDYDFSQLNEADEQEEKIIIINESTRIQTIIKDIYKDNNKLFQVSAREFEELIAELLYAQGFKVELTKQTRDKGYDIMAIKKIGLLDPLKFLVECKRYKYQKVGVGIIRSFKEVIVTENANRGIIVTTGYFSRDAIKKQKETPYLLDYRDKDQVMEWVADYWKGKVMKI